jgi:hypothetical protein
MKQIKKKLACMYTPTSYLQLRGYSMQPRNVLVLGGPGSGKSSLVRYSRMSRSILMKRTGVFRSGRIKPLRRRANFPSQV